MRRGRDSDGGRDSYCLPTLWYMGSTSIGQRWGTLTLEYRMDLDVKFDYNILYRNIISY
jgi:hypothetical protein